MTEERCRKEYNFYMNTDSQVMSNLGKKKRAAAFTAHTIGLEDMWMTEHHHHPTKFAHQVAPRPHLQAVPPAGLSPVPGRFRAVWDKDEAHASQFISAILRLGCYLEAVEG